jgi:NADH-quinone oxidoreductase subunit M
MHEELTFGFPILSLLILLPLLGALVISLLEDEDLINNAALAVSLVELVLAAIIVLRFVPDSAAMQFSERLPWIAPLGITYHLAVDGISVLFVALTALLTVLIVLYSMETVRRQIKTYYMALFALETTIVGIFVSIDLILFFVFWELMLIPSYFLIKLWGNGVERQYAALKFVLYTLLGSVFMLVGIVLLNLNYHDWALLHRLEPAYSFDLLQLLSVPIPRDQQLLIFWLLFLGLAFKAPIFPFHTWLPDALMEGPIGMAIILAGIKLGTYALAGRRARQDRRHHHDDAWCAGHSVWGLDCAHPTGLASLAGVQQHQPPGICPGWSVRAELSRAARKLAHDDQPWVQHRRALLYRRVSL